MAEFFLLMYILGIIVGLTLVYFGFKTGELDTYGNLISATALAFMPVLGFALTSFVLIDLVSKSDFWNKPIKKVKK